MCGLTLDDDILAGSALDDLDGTGMGDDLAIAVGVLAVSMLAVWQGPR